MRDDNGYPIPRKAYAIRPDADTCYVLQVFSRTDPDVAEALRVEDNDDLAASLSGLSAHYGGPGRWFTTTPMVRIGKRNVVVRQFRGLDV